MDGDVGRVRTERIYTLPATGPDGRRRDSEDGEGFHLDEDVDEPQLPPDEAPSHEHGSVGHPDDDEAGRNLDITG